MHNLVAQRRNVDRCGKCGGSFLDMWGETTCLMCGAPKHGRFPPPAVAIAPQDVERMRRESAAQGQAVAIAKAVATLEGRRKERMAEARDLMDKGLSETMTRYQLGLSQRQWTRYKRWWREEKQGRRL